jgi:hypothetical protein
LLSFRSTSPAPQACVAPDRSTTTDPQTIEITIKAYLTEMRARLEKATSIAKAAEACALSDNYEKGIELGLDIEQIVYEVNIFLNAASLINRLRKT